MYSHIAARSSANGRMSMKNASTVQGTDDQELQCQIYGYLVFHVPNGRPSPTKGVICREGMIHTAILTTNRKVYNEALPVIYGNTTWHIEIWNNPAPISIPDDVVQLTTLPDFQQTRHFQLVIYMLKATIHRVGVDTVVPWSSFNTFRDMH